MSIVLNVIFAVTIVLLLLKFRRTTKEHRKQMSRASVRIMQAERDMLSKAIVDSIAPIAFVKKMKGKLH